ncbi:MAG: SDR family oxidoreductase, partial [Candidatus Pelagibacterales bacterium]
LAVKKAKKFLKEIDVVLHVAGGGFGLKDKLIKNDDLKKLLQINLGAAIEINRLVISGKNRRKLLKLVHVGSIASNEAVGSVGYNIAKSGLAAYVRSLGRELYKDKIVVTGILPGGFTAQDNAMERFRKKNNKDYKKFIKTRLPRGFMGNADEILPMLLFLCSRHSSMMGGCLVPIDAGEGKVYQT